MHVREFGEASKGSCGIVSMTQMDGRLRIPGMIETVARVNEIEGIDGKIFAQPLGFTRDRSDRWAEIVLVEDLPVTVGERIDGRDLYPPFAPAFAETGERPRPDVEQSHALERRIEQLADFVLERGV